MWNKLKINETETIHSKEQQIFRIGEKINTDGTVNYRIILGDKLVDEKQYNTIEEAKERIEKIDWVMISALIQAINVVTKDKE